MPDPSPFGREDARRYYDRAGSFQDKQGFYEDVALDALVAHGEFAEARSVLEVGCGTGRFAQRLLEDHLPASARYLGIDISATMIDLATKRLAPWSARAQVRQTDGDFDYAALGGPFDRAVCTYVFDLLSPADIAAALAGIHAALMPGGLLCAAGLTHGTTALSRLTSSTWTWLRGISPSLVGGCRPLVLSEQLPAGQWRLVRREVVIGATVPSEVVIAQAL